MGRLDGKVAVITGATSGIGLRTAEIFVAEGAKIVIAGRRVPEGEALAKKLGANCVFRQTDVTVEDEMRALIGEAVEKFGRIDCLFNNAGGPAQTGGIEGLEVDALRRRDGDAGAQRDARHEARRAPYAQARAPAASSTMAASPAGWPAFRRRWSMARPRPPSSISPNAWRWSSANPASASTRISPGAIATGIFGKALGLSVEAAEKTPDVMREVYKTAQPIPRAGLPEDIAHAAVFLASDESSFINGHDLVVDGAITGGRNWTPTAAGPCRPAQGVRSR